MKLAAEPVPSVFVDETEPPTEKLQASVNIWVPPGLTTRITEKVESMKYTLLYWSTSRDVTLPIVPPLSPVLTYVLAVWHVPVP